MTAPGREQAAPAGSGADIEAALGEVARHLEARDPVAAAAAIARVTSACAAAEQAGLDETTRTRLQPLLIRCTTLASETQATLAASLVRLGTGSRANRAYNAE